MKLSSSVSSWSTLLLFASGNLVNAQPQGNRPFGGGNFGNRPGFPGLQPDFVTKTCDAQWECPLHHRRRGGDGDDEDANTDETGIFICRQTYHPIFGTLQTRAKCISTEEAYETDDCGCCGEDCPPIPSLQNISCDADTPDDGLVGLGEDEATFVANNDPRDRRGLGRRGGNGGNRLPENAVVVCRPHFNPYTGIQERMSMYIDPSKSLEGDVCGCCDGVCPDELDTGRPQFARPDHVELTWCDANTGTTGVNTGNEYTSCTLPPRNNGGETEGAFVCRSMANMLTGIAESQTLCIPPDRAWETDQCGCCGEDCPDQPLPVDLECSVGPTDENGNAVPAATITQECPFRNGDTGIFACRSLFHPLDGSVIQRTLCLRDDEEDGENAWATDQCGCCGSSCPETPQGGFPRVDRQMMELSLEEDSINSDFAGELRTEGVIVNDSDSNSLFGVALGLILLFLTVVAIAMVLFPRYIRSPETTSYKY
mmetsp:Transcript_29633/g.71305  ORF Transcript_29633/g.71305 Transcript_29633/m.71305 type:complete len:483 (+) Transcript_29633:114-1562(+)